MVPQYNPWQQPAPAQPQPAAPYASPYPSTPPAPADGLSRVLPYINQANSFLPRLLAGQLAILYVIAAVGKRTNSHPYFPSLAEQGELQVLRQFQLVESQGQGYTLTLLGDAVIVAERLNRMAALA